MIPQAIFDNTRRVWPKRVHLGRGARRWKVNMEEGVFVRSETPFGDQVLETAYSSVVAELEALAPEEIVQVNLDIMAALNTAAGVIPELKALRPRIVEALPLFDVAAFDKLHLYALAAGYAHTMHLVAGGPQNSLRPTFEEAVKLRRLLLSDAKALAARGLIKGEALKNLKGPIGYKNVQTDLQMLVNVFKASWANIQGKCAVTESELTRGGKLVACLMDGMGLREQAPAELVKSADMRARAFTLFTRTYDDARRAVGFLRSKNADVDDIIPSLYAGRSNGRTAKGKKAAEVAANAPSTAAPTTTETPTNAPVATVDGRSVATTLPPARIGGPFAA
jgi:hypothetical protein